MFSGHFLGWFWEGFLGHFLERFYEHNAVMNTNSDALWTHFRTLFLESFFWHLFSTCLDNDLENDMNDIWTIFWTILGTIFDLLETFAVAVSLTDICLHFTIYLESFGKEHLKNWHRKLEFAKWIWPWCLLSSSDFSNASCGQICTFEVSKQNWFLTSRYFWSHCRSKSIVFFSKHYWRRPSDRKSYKESKNTYVHCPGGPFRQISILI